MCDLSSLTIKQAKALGIVGQPTTKNAALCGRLTAYAGILRKLFCQGTILAAWEEKAVREDRGGVAFVVACAINPASSELAALFKIQARSMKN
jgi:hypothetical protein